MSETELPSAPVTTLRGVRVIEVALQTM